MSFGFRNILSVVWTAAVIAVAALVCAPEAMGATKGRRGLNDKVLNRPYADMRAWHLGFSVGMHAQDLKLTHNGFITADGEEWRMEQPNFQPGFNVSGLFDLRLNNYFSLRFSPGMYFGSRDITMRELGTGSIERQSIKSTYITLPVDLKFAAQRWRNLRPYVVGGVMGAFDVSKKRADYLRLTTGDAYLTVGFGCDFYLPYFKLIPELKFCFGLTDVLQHDRPDLVDDPASLKFTQSLSKATSKMIVLSFYFE
ncbi:MAG: PorT family protein [Muribaculaceae bacterium]|nr:PorT family protein [Muribaculaceae bacterium]